ncbi:hypothetical protein TELCIR_05840 [Teladorsagia circumcincta]|uniref:Uncharacterized protein n=1 Tax=Teladorsagia circumcincta TaxID=45464 RepID=A0A2G9UPP3_TELCI|nr:hypothetical protein TELCIR_05840 [Teladorsagia circumcincta]
MQQICMEPSSLEKAAMVFLAGVDTLAQTANEDYTGNQTQTRFQVVTFRWLANETPYMIATWLLVAALAKISLEGHDQHYKLSVPRKGQENCEGKAIRQECTLAKFWPYKRYGIFSMEFSTTEIFVFSALISAVDPMLFIRPHSKIGSKSKFALEHVGVKREICV